MFASLNVSLRGLVDEDGDGLDFLLAITHPVNVPHVKVREALALLALLELGNVGLECLQNKRQERVVSSHH